MPKNDSFVDTPDGIGNISSVDLLREEVTVRLDSAPESPKRYKCCEICVLRNGKGSREGIEIPQERPQRYTPQEALPEEPQEPRPQRRSAPPVKEAIAIPSVLADESKEESKSGSRRRSRGGRRGGDKVKTADTGKPAPEKKAEKNKDDNGDDAGDADDGIRQAGRRSRRRRGGS